MIRVAQGEIETIVPVGAPSSGKTNALINEVAGPIRTVLTLLCDESREVCLIQTPFSALGATSSPLVRAVVAETTGLSVEQVLIFSSHNHCVPVLAAPDPAAYTNPAGGCDPDALLPVGRLFIRQLRQAAKRLRKRLTPVVVHWAVSQERRITYNRKGRRADGSTYFMREADRGLVASDFTGDIDADATLIGLIGRDGVPVGFLSHFTGHPVTAYHPERLRAFGEWPQVACEVVSSKYGGVPCGFMQGCCGDSNSKHFLSGDVSVSTRLGRQLGATFLGAARRLKASKRQHIGLLSAEALVPFGHLPSQRALARDLDEIDDFIVRAEKGDEETLQCVGLNFPQTLSPIYRAKLVLPVQAWTQWAMRMHTSGKADALPRHLPMTIYALRLGDIGIVGLPCEPFLGIGRQIKMDSPLPVAITCGYVNYTYGYVTDAPNTGDREYMSSFYRYTNSFLPYRPPAGDVLAQKGLRMLTELCKK